MIRKKINKKVRYRIVCEDDNNSAVVDATVSAETDTQDQEENNEEESNEPVSENPQKPEVNPEDIVGYIGYGVFPNGWKNDVDNTEFFQKMDEIITKRKTANMNPDEQREAAKKILANADAFLKSFGEE